MLLEIQNNNNHDANNGNGNGGDEDPNINSNDTVPTDLNVCDLETLSMFDVPLVVAVFIPDDKSCSICNKSIHEYVEKAELKVLNKAQKLLLDTACDTNDGSGSGGDGGDDGTNAGNRNDRRFIKKAKRLDRALVFSALYSLDPNCSYYSSPAMSNSNSNSNSMDGNGKAGGDAGDDDDDDEDYSCSCRNLYNMVIERIRRRGGAKEGITDTTTGDGNNIVVVSFKLKKDDEGNVQDLDVKKMVSIPISTVSDDDDKAKDNNKIIEKLEKALLKVT